MCGVCDATVGYMTDEVAGASGSGSVSVAVDRNDPNYNSDGEYDMRGIRSALPRRFSAAEREFASSIADFTQFKTAAEAGCR